MPDVVLARVVTPLPVDAFVAVSRAINSLLVDVPEDQLVVVPIEDGDGDCNIVLVDGDPAPMFRRGHFEIRWIDDA